MKRHYFISDNLDDLVQVESELKERGLSVFQIHVLSRDDAAVERHKLHEVASSMKRDILRSTKIGILLGLIAGLLVIGVVKIAGWATTEASWMPYIFLAVALLVFFAWEGGLKGIQEPNKRFLRFETLLSEGKHVFFVDVNEKEAQILGQVAAAHPALYSVGTEAAGAHWLISCEQKWQDVVKTLP